MRDTLIDNKTLIQVRNRLTAGDEIEVIDPESRDFSVAMPQMVRVRSNSEEQVTKDIVDEAHANYLVEVDLGRPVKRYSLLRRRVVNPDR